MSLRVYNTLTRQKELFEPVVPGKVGIYLCGPTVYRPSHIGHAVGPIIFDAVKRYLVHKGYSVRWIVNITDVDDKIMQEAARQGRPVQDIAREVEAAYRQALDALNVRGIDAFPRATEHVGDIIELVGRLVEKGAAYVCDGDVYFDHLAYPDYGKLSGRRAEDQLAGSRELAGENKRHPADFALWKACQPEEPGWDSPWGRGRPGWHIECSAMSLKILGETLDIHGGGMELVFPHHENELAQSETATGKPFVKYWMHNGLTRGADRQKMSKSLGNIRLLEDLLKAYAGETIRAFVLSTHYRRPLDFSDEQLDNAAKALETFYRLFDRIRRATGADPYAEGSPIDRLHEQAATDTDREFVKTVLKQRLAFYEAMDDDFNTANALAALHALAGTVNRYLDQTALEAARSEPPATLAAAAAVTLVQTGRILGLFDVPPKKPDAAGPDAAEIERLLAERAEARERKDFQTADDIRNRLTEMGIVLEDTPGGTVWRKA